MLDGVAKRSLNPLLDSAGQSLARRGIGADSVTIAGFALGVAAGIAIYAGWLLAALGLILASRLLDGLDGAVARASRPTDRGGFLDIVLDFAFYGTIPLAFVLHDPAANGAAGAFLLLAFYINGASFLAYAVLAEKRGLTSEARGRKSLYFTTGLAEATETLIVFIAFCLFPSWFTAIATFFALICLYTALSRIILAWLQFGDGTGGS
ncbi:CDP-alcohol phosphatidyltransferase family protein [Pararhizobium haloflavum]|uniref:CDP-alcohol phosphatidyltransferase family protein n=1 Tax=Pararhizobium haloflavum TaxID=2037914 RepID=UPI000C197D2C|nr:CDP-alcohol phosphatidyltransferase family protein [Pararhizobium haloflavum]